MQQLGVRAAWRAKVGKEMSVGIPVEERSVVDTRPRYFVFPLLQVVEDRLLFAQLRQPLQDSFVLDVTCDSVSLGKQSGFIGLIGWCWSRRLFTKLP